MSDAPLANGSCVSYPKCRGVAPADRCGAHTALLLGGKVELDSPWQIKSAQPLCLTDLTRREQRVASGG